MDSYLAIKLLLDTETSEFCPLKAGVNLNRGEI